MPPYIYFFPFAGLLAESMADYGRIYTAAKVMRFDFNETVNEILYRVSGATERYYEAEKKCHKNGGHLAKITMDLLSNTGPSPLSNFMSTFHGSKRSRSWIGMADVAEEGDWRWFDDVPNVAKPTTQMTSKTPKQRKDVSNVSRPKIQKTSKTPK